MTGRAAGIHGGVPNVEIRPWSGADLGLLHEANTPAMTRHLAGAESGDEVRVRHENYMRFWHDGTARMFVIVADGDPVGGIGWWSTRWRDSDVHETGWFVLPAAQGQGVARAALRLVVEDARIHGSWRLMTAYPSITNGASNALCAASGFAREGTESLPFRGAMLEVAVWTLDLRPG